MIALFIQVLLYGFTSMILVYLAGKIVLSFFEINISPDFKLLSNYVVGLVVWVLIYSVAKTGFKTINLSLLPLLAGLVYYYRKNIKKFAFEFNNLKSDLLLSLGIFLAVFFFQSLFYFDFSNDTWLSLHTDHYLYADFSNSLKLFGTESKFTDLTHFFGPDGLVPYHYPELWLTSLFSSLFGVSSICSYFLLVIPVGASIFLLGCYTLFEKHQFSPYLKFAIVIASAFVSGIYFPTYDGYEITKYVLQADQGILSLFSQKLCIIYIFILYSAILFIKQQRQLSLLVLAVVPVFSIGFLPGLIGGILLYSVFTLVMQLRAKQVIRPWFSIATALYIVLFIMAFYQFFKSNYTSEIVNDDVFLKKLIQGSVSVLEIKIFIGNTLFRFLRPIIFYLPFSPFLFVFLKKMKSLSVLYFFILISGIITSSLMFGVMDATQFASNVYILFNILVIIGLSLSIEFASARLKVASIAFYVIVILVGLNTMLKNKTVASKSIDKPIYTQIAAELKEETSNILVFLDKDNFKKIPLAWWQLRNDLLPVTQCTDHDVIFSLGNPDLYFESSDKITSTDSVFFNYLLPVSNIAHQQLTEEFIKANKIKYLYAKTGVDVSAYTSNIDTCITSPSINGSFYVLK